MKSKIYSSRYMKISSKGQVWIPAFAAIGFLLAFPVAELIMLGNWFGMAYTGDQISTLYENLWRDGFMITGMAVAALTALFCGISQFWYLYSPRKVDFYHSLPVKRSRLFWYKTMQSLLYFFLPYLAMEFISVCIGAMRGFFSLHLMKLAFLLLLYHLLIFLLLYFSVVLVICLTGHPLMGVLALVAVAAYGPILSLLIQLYENAFYYTCAGIQYGLTEFLTNYVSPLMLAYTFAGNYAAGTHHRILCFIVVLVLAEGILGYLVYVKRKSESAGKAFAFSWTGEVLRYLIVVPAGLGTGMIFYLLPTETSRNVWWIFGMILGTILTNGIMNVIYHMDFRKFFVHRLQLGAAGILVALFAGIFFFDLTGYDRYIPSLEKIQNVEVGFYLIDSNENYVIELTEDGAVSKRRNETNIGIDEGIYSCLEKIRDHNKEICQELMGDDFSWMANIYDNTGRYVRLPVTYQLKSGQEICRYYMTDREVLKEFYQACFEQGTLRKERYSILQLDNKYLRQIKGAFCNGEWYTLFQDNAAKMDQLLDAMRQDIEEADAEVLTGVPCANLTFDFENVPTVEKIWKMLPGENESVDLEGIFYVFPEFKRTVKLLKETGYPISMEDVDITSVEAVYYIGEEKNTVSSPVVYESKEQLEELKKVLRNGSLSPIWEPGTFNGTWAWITVKIDGEDAGNDWTVKSVPAFMQEDAERAKAFQVYEQE